MIETSKLTTLYRPTGEVELLLVAESAFSVWPPRLPEQPIFYPVTNEDYAVQIARDWNAKEDATGFVTAFEVRSAYLDRFDRQVVGDAQVHTEYWIPAKNLPECNAEIVGSIRVIGAFRGNPPTELSPEHELARIQAAGPL